MWLLSLQAMSAGASLAELMVEWMDEMQNKAKVVRILLVSADFPK